jgi:hypothetical protein
MLSRLDTLPKNGFAFEVSHMKRRQAASTSGGTSDEFDHVELLRLCDWVEEVIEMVEDEDGASELHELA